MSMDAPPGPLLTGLYGLQAANVRRRSRKCQADREAKWLREGERHDRHYQELAENPIIDDPPPVRPVDQELRQLAAAVIEQQCKVRIEQALAYKRRWEGMGFRMGVRRQKGKTPTVWLAPRKDMTPEDDAALQDYQQELLAVMEAK